MDNTSLTTLLFGGAAKSGSGREIVSNMPGAPPPPTPISPVGAQEPAPLSPSAAGVKAPMHTGHQQLAATHGWQAGGGARGAAMLSSPSVADAASAVHNDLCCEFLR